MLNEMNENNLFCDYYEQWVAVYKEGAVRPVTLDKYKMTLSWVRRLAPDLKLCEVSRVTYQQLLNDYAVGHERQTTMDFHHQLKGAIMDAVDDGLIVKDPTRKAIIKGKPPVPKKVKYLNQFELHLLLSDLDLQGKLNWDWMILLIAKTGIRFPKLWRSLLRILTFRTRCFPSIKHGIIRGTADFCRQKINRLSAKFRSTGRR